MYRASPESSSTSPSKYPRARSLYPDASVTETNESVRSVNRASAVPSNWRSRASTSAVVGRRCTTSRSASWPKMP
jgi:hypothetical protein